MSAAEYEGVLRDMRLPSGAVWPVPVTLDVSEVFAAGLQRGDTIALRDAEGLLAAIMEVGEIWRPEKDEEARAVYGTHDQAHPGVSCLLHRTHPVHVSGRVTGFGPILHYDHRALRDSPAELHERFHKLGWRRVVAFQTRNPPSPRGRAHPAGRACVRSEPSPPSRRGRHPCGGCRSLHPGALLRTRAGAFSRPDRHPEPAQSRDAHGRLALGLEIPEWFTFPEIAAELRRAWPPRHLQGSTVLFTGLSGAGKSTLANALVAMLRESGDVQFPTAGYTRAGARERSRNHWGSRSRGEDRQTAPSHGYVPVGGL